MTVLRIEHPVMDFDLWKSAFDSDPVGRQKAGVLRYRVMRSADDPMYVLVDLEFQSAGEAQAVLGTLRTIWDNVQGKLIGAPSARIAETIEEQLY